MEGDVLDVLVQKRRNKKAALKLLRKLLKNQGFVPEAIVTDALRDLANWLFRQLEQEYEYLTSDEVVDETLVVGGYTFTEEGRRFG